MMNEHYELTCMMCGTNVGQLLGGRFVPPASGALTTRVGGRLRCSRCGGSLYLEPIDAAVSSLDPLVRAAQIEAAIHKQAGLRPRSAAASADGAEVADEAAAPGAA
jgi:hypothetical protein